MFILLLESSIIWTGNQKDSFLYLLFFLVGGLWWLVSFNNRKEWRGLFNWWLLVYGLIFGGIYAWFSVINKPEVNAWSLYLPTSSFRNHNNIGDLWSVIMAGWIVGISKKKSKPWIWWLVMLTGLMFTAVSRSRSAILSLVAGIWLVQKRVNFRKKYPQFARGALIIIIGIFIFMGLSKTTLLSRQQYFQSIVGLWKHPGGVGIGIFEVISKNPDYHLWGMSAFSTVTHNLPLEILAGMGWAGLIFIYWMIKQIKMVVKSKDKRILVYQAAFIALTVNFMFHLSYFAPSLLWLWFLLLGLISEKDSLKR